MGKLGFGDFLKVGALLGEAAYNDSQVKKNNNTVEYQEELRQNIENLAEWSDVELLRSFHEEYDDYRGKGLFEVNAGNRMDPMFMAYLEVFKKRKIEQKAVRCRECDRRLGYRMIPRHFSVISDEDDLVRGYCNCRCGKSRVWQIYGDSSDESYICVYEY